jgi:RNA polymerase sigma factor (sigma-70 family)
VHNEQELISRLQSPQHKDQAFRELLKLYQERLYWHIRKMVYHHDDADDVLQNTFVKIFRHIDSFKGDSKIYSWMYRIATNEAISFLNQKAKMQNITLEEVKEQALNNLTEDIYFEGDQLQLELQKAIATLPHKQQLVFNMKYFDDLTYEELSEILGTSVGALKASYHLAVKKITAYLSKS